jgi:hypothetical protein
MTMLSDAYAQIAPDVRCLICGTSNSSQAMQCGECSAPLSMVHDAATQGRDPHMISVVGESNVGKTVLLGFLLDMLSRRAGDFEAIPKGAYSVELQQNVVSHMANRQFPPKTPLEPNQWHWAYYQICKKTPSPKWVDLIMPDMAGDSLAAEVGAPKTFQVIRHMLGRSMGILMLVDAAMAADGSHQPDFFALKILSYIETMKATKPNARVQTPIAVVLCKADLCPECFDDPRQFVQANLNRVWNMCESRFDNVAFFASSVVGSLGYAAADRSGYLVPVPLHTALRGVLEPFEWILNQS